MLNERGKSFQLLQYYSEWSMQPQPCCSYVPGWGHTSPEGTGMQSGMRFWIQKEQGANSYGQLGLGHKEDVLLPQVLKEFPYNQKTIRSIVGGGGHSAVVTDIGEVFLCGQNKDGQLGLNHTEDVTHFMLCSSLSGCPVVQVACGWDFTIILAGNGQVLSCGSNSFGQLGVPHASGGCPIPQKIESLKDKVVNVAAGLRHALAATENGSVFQWGIGMVSLAKRACQGKIIPSFLTAKEPCKVTGLESIKVKSVTSGSYHAASLTDEGELYVWGSNKHKQLVSNDDFLLQPHKIENHYFLGEKVRRVWSGWTHLVAQTDLGKIFTWGRGEYGQLGRNAMLLHDGLDQDLKRSTAHCLQELLNVPVAVPNLTGASEEAYSKALGQPQRKPGPGSPPNEPEATVTTPLQIFVLKS
ncbi:secretion-regulating guanine nucleotide exchange factor isoform X4 [Hemicordylus capensis]|uniref:secretion-regulating guanine nucleotide exchange factor isoform X4 n=1 Tax=Hemicordylus capensis TaxID=884348 RepID=UPI002303AAA0|nr:secretion-regulating guanine nucleotide exchange factor isoform X4 [Hemicordylus capensis]